MSAFSDAYNNLNYTQRQAVDTIEGPLLVIAGPGTGKTQLLSARVANILRKTDTPPQNILCLTFTENGAANMRQRLTRFIGQAAYDVTVGTYHAFGGDLIHRFPEYFADSRLQSPVDDLGKRQIVLEIVEAMPYDNPLKQSRHHLGDLMSTLSEIKRALLTSNDLRSLSAENSQFIKDGSSVIHTVFSKVLKMPGSLAKAEPYFESALTNLAPIVPTKPSSTKYQPLAVVCIQQLVTALQAARTAGKSTPLTVWKNSWLAKDASNGYIIAGALENRRIMALADVLEAYQAVLADKAMYDFDDMILRSIKALEDHADLRYSLQERYQYIMLDEFQDTNAAQLRLVQLLTDNPVNEGRPNVLAVGDDDQAIYAFQGAQYSNMMDYYSLYRDTKVINLTENYRSHAAIIHTAQAVASQIDSRLDTHFDGITKLLSAANPTIESSTIERRDFQSEIAERAWIAAAVKQLIDSGVAPSQIAVLAPKHKQLEPLVAYLNASHVPVRYEKRENILQARVVRQLIIISRLLLALASNDTASASALWPQVLSYDFWHIPTAVIWELSWQVADSKTATGAAKLSWSQAILGSTNPQCRVAAQLVLTVANRLETDSYEEIMDYVIGSAVVELHDGTTVSSPLRAFYTSAAVQSATPELFYETISHLTVLRSRLRDYQETADTALTLANFVDFVGLYETAEQPLINTSPYSQQADAVQLMTVFKAKGLEFDHVFLPQCLDDVWGSSSRGSSNKLTLPPNLQPIRHAGATDDERLRILFVALTRARRGLHLTSAVRTFSGKTTKRLKYFNEQEQPSGDFQAKILPEGFQAVISEDFAAPSFELLELDWQTRHLQAPQNTSLAGLLSDRISKYQLSPTHLVSFLDLEYAGPSRFFFNTILRFPSAPSANSQYGTSIHETLEWYQQQLNAHGDAPPLKQTLDRFTLQISAKKLPTGRIKIEAERGKAALTAYLAQRADSFHKGDIAEKSFRSEAVFVGNDVHMAGKIDRLSTNSQTRNAHIIDYKTGKSYSTWKNDSRLHKYKLQLYAYKLLVEGSKSYRGYVAATASLEFIEPNDLGAICRLELTFDSDELQRISLLIAAVWQHVKDLNFPDTSSYPATLAGINQFEADLIDGVI